MKSLIIYEDNHLMVVVKPAGLLVQGDETGDQTLFDRVKEYIRLEYQKPGNVYLGLVHRLDRPASGLVCFAKTSKAAARLSAQFRQKTAVKKYLALVEGNVPESGCFRDSIERREQHSFISSKGKTAVLSFQKIAFKNNISMVEVDLKTGRHHQIRVQFAHRGFFLLGDFRYGSKIKFQDQSLALHAYYLEIEHPTLKERKIFKSPPGENWPEYFRTIADKWVHAD
ncbi:MAG: RluA family pseudouridine synthase [Candidatus Marinimicrobia bacterium]|nr:RluA family pseudouridine synthase [Candidatus Neomarinimicrobiota bacterium]